MWEMEETLLNHQVTFNSASTIVKVEPIYRSVRMGTACIAFAAISLAISHHIHEKGICFPNMAIKPHLHEEES